MHVPRGPGRDREHDLRDEERDGGRGARVARAGEQDVPERMHERGAECEQERRGRHARTLESPPDAGPRDHLRLQRHALRRRADPLRDLPAALRRARQAAVSAGVLRRARGPLRPGDRAHLARRRPSRRRRGDRRARRALPRRGRRRLLRARARPRGGALRRRAGAARNLLRRRPRRDRAGRRGRRHRRVLSDDRLVRRRRARQARSGGLPEDAARCSETRRTRSSSRTPRPASPPPRPPGCA